MEQAQGLSTNKGKRRSRKHPIKGGIVGDDQVGGGSQRGHGLLVELLAEQLVTGDAGKSDHLCVERLAGILKTGIAGQHVIEHALGGEVEGQTRQLDDLIAGGVQPGGLDVDDQAEALQGGRVIVGIAGDHRDAAQNAVVAALLQAEDGQLFEIGGIGHLDLRCRGPYPSCTLAAPPRGQRCEEITARREAAAAQGAGR